MFVIMHFLTADLASDDEVISVVEDFFFKYVKYCPKKLNYLALG